MPRAAWIYVVAVWISAAATCILAFAPSAGAPTSVWLFLSLAAVTTLLRLFVIGGPLHRTFEGSTIGFFAAVLLLPPWLFIVVVIVSHGVEWVKERWTKSEWLKAWYLQPFNISKTILGGAATYWVIDLIRANPFGPPPLSAFLAAVLAVAVYVGMNQLLLGIALFLARGISFRDSGILRDALLLEAPLACIGYVAFQLVQDDPPLVILVLAPMLLIYQALMLPKVQYESLQSLKRANEDLSQANRAILQLNDELFLTLAKIFDARDPYVGGHAAQVSTYAVAIGSEMKLPAAQIEELRRGAYLHDIGKIAIPESILHKPARLTDEEYELVKTHAEIGGDFIATSQGLRHLVPFIRHHHERWDGRGYPAGLAGDSIPLEARILNLCDSVEAMASDRPYHKSMSSEEIIAEIRRCAGKQFDPNVVAMFIRVVEKHGPDFVVNSARTVAAQYAENGLTVEGLPAALFAHTYMAPAE